MHQVVQVPPLSRKKIRAYADQARAALEIDDDFFPIMEVIEFRLPPAFVLEVWDQRDMDNNFGSGTHAMTYPNELRMILRQDVYCGAWKGKGRDRFTVAHEFAHLLLHQAVGNARRLPTELLAFENSEWQADTFASELLMPMSRAMSCRTMEEMASRFGVSFAAARVRITVIEQEAAHR